MDIADLVWRRSDGLSFVSKVTASLALYLRRKTRKATFRGFLLVPYFFAFSGLPAAAQSATFSTVYRFCAQPDCVDGQIPSGLVQATNGYLYGTTLYGGVNIDYGTAFQFNAANGALTTLYNFCSQPGCADGSNPGGLIQATDGNFYGATSGGVSNNCPLIDGCGTLFRLTPGGTLTTLYSFCSQTGCSDGIGASGLVEGTDGDFYGTTGSGGASQSCSQGFAIGCGTVFRITSSGALTTLYSFCSQSSCNDGAYPISGLVQGANGDFYGTTASGGANQSCSLGFGIGCGTVFRITPSGALTTLYSFCSLTDCADGYYPSGLLQGADGDFYGTTQFSPYNVNANCLLASGCGTVFKITPNGTLTTLYSFGSQVYDGVYPGASLIQATDGNFYGTTEYGGNSGTLCSPNQGCGTVFQITPSGTLTTLHSFCSWYCMDSEYPFGLVQATNGALYGTTVGGRSTNGTIFSVSLVPPPCPVNVTVSVGGVGGTSMNATLVAPSGMTLPAAAAACGFAGFDWQQTVTNLPCPSPFSATPLSVLSQQNRCSPNGPLTAPPAFNDPPAGGYADQPTYNPYPFYYPSASALDNEQSPGTACVYYSSNLASCIIPLVSADDTTLAFYDAPADPCLPFGDFVLQSAYCGGVTDPPLSFLSFTTALVGIEQDGTASPPLFQWIWSDYFNGTSGGVPAISNNLPVDPGSGTGGITITSVNGVPVVNYMVSGQVTLSGSPLGGVTMTTSGSESESTTTDGSGNYSFTAPAGGNFTITPSLAGYTFSPLSQSFNNLNGNQTASFIANPVGSAYMISGLVTFGGNGLSGVTVTLSGSQNGTAMTSNSGLYSFAAQAGGSYTVTPSLAGYLFNPVNLVFNNLTGNQANADFAATNTQCAYSANPSAVYLDATSQSGPNLSVSAGLGCTWTAAAGGFITITSGANGTGNGSVTFTVQANSSGEVRTSTLTVAGQTITVTQRETVAIFADVTPPDYYFDFAGIMDLAGITAGCSTNPPDYCPNSTTTRGEMAVFLITSIFHGQAFNYPPPPYFTDVPASNPFFPFIQELRSLGITDGCTATTFCPNNPVTRAEMAAFIIAARYASTPYTYPSTPYFSDVPASNPFFPFIQKTAQAGITAGCGSGLYCPNETLTRGQMAVFIVTGLLNDLLPAGTPTIASAAPNSATPGQTVTVTLTGVNTNFVQGTTLVTAPPGVTASNIIVLSGTSLTVQLAVGASVVPNPTTIVVTTGTAEAVLPNGFLVQ